MNLAYMKKLVLLVLMAVMVSGVFAQKEELTNTVLQFHQAMTGKDFNTESYLHKNLSYGHSNGWIQDKSEFLKDTKTGYLIYHSYIEDSMNVVVNNNVAYVRFKADIESTKEGTKTMSHLKVLEVWVKDKSSWKIFVRQAIRLNP
jgi:hypothetical protein